MPIYGGGERYYEREMTMNKSEMLQMVEELRRANPYPPDIFVGIIEEGKIGQFGFRVWTNCCDAITLLVEEWFEAADGTEGK